MSKAKKKGKRKNPNPRPAGPWVKGEKFAARLFKKGRKLLVKVRKV